MHGWNYLIVAIYSVTCLPKQYFLAGGGWGEGYPHQDSWMTLVSSHLDCTKVDCTAKCMQW